MKFCKEAILLSVVALGLGACSDENPWSGHDGEGGISLKLTANADVKDAIPVLRSGADALEAPNTQNFAISLTNLSTSEVQKWNSLSDFNAQSGFRTGSYTLAAFYGSLEEEGFDKPYYYGETEITVLEGRESSAEITATLANSMVSVDYTEAFKNYFKDYAVTIHSEGHSYVEYPAEETRPAFIAPGEVSLAVNVTNLSGKSATLQPAAFPAAAAHHYHITFDVNSNAMGGAQLQIVFDDSVESEDVTIDLTDELFTSPAPKVEPEGFVDGEVLEALSGSASADNTLRFNVVARGGIQGATLTFASENFTPAFGNELDLVKATPTQQQQLADMGIKVVGLFKNPSTLAYVDVTELPKHLPEGKCAVSLVVKDPFTRVSEPVTLNFTTVPIEVEATAGIAIFGSNQATIYIDYNGADPEKNFSFQAFSKAGVYKDVEILSVTESTRTRSFETKSYVFTISLPDTDRDEISVRVLFNGVERKRVAVPVMKPEYSLEADALAKYAKLKVTTVNADDLAAVVNCVKLFANGNEVSESNLTRNNETGIITVSGLTPATNYTFGATLTGSTPDHTVAATTEAATDVENGDFSQSHQTINMTDVQVGGTYTGTAFSNPKYHWSSSIVVSEPDGWASINAKTCYSGSSNINTWFCVPSTYVENGAVVIRNVGFDHAGTTPDVDKTTAGYYNKNAPSFGSGKQAAGELFLGSYSFDGSEHKTPGIAFSTRPSSLSFDYKYTSVSNDVAIAEIQVLDASGAVIASGSTQLQAQSSMTSSSTTLPAYAFGAKAASVRISFKSSNNTLPPINIPTGSDLKEQDGVKLGNHTLDANTYHALAVGSVLTIDNVKLNY